MKISGFSYVRNGFDYDVPFLESIQSILPVCDEFIVAVGDSVDGTREAIENLHSPKIKIIDTVWDPMIQQGGKIFAQQSNIALDHITGDWAFHIQADEVIHEKDLPKVLEAIENDKDNKKVDGFLFPFIHFWGGYNYVRTSRRVHRNEVRVFRNDKYIRSYRDSQGFRIYSSKEAYEQGTDSGKKLKVKKIDVPVYHYNAVRPPQRMKYKIEHINAYFNNGVIPAAQLKNENLQNVDRLELFQGSHPALMMPKVEAQDWEFVFDPKKANWRMKDRLVQPLEDLLGIRIGEYKNYILLK